jgi:hypothetical protein
MYLYPSWLALIRNRAHLYDQTMLAIDQKIPFVVRLLGYGGVVPFVALATLSFLVSPAHKPYVMFSLLAYGGTIISFVGAIHWGFTMLDARPSRSELLWGVCPSLLAWISLLLQVEIGLLFQAFVLLVCLVVDYKTYPLYGLHQWLPMRLRLSIAAILSTGVPALADLSGLVLGRV